ARAIELDERNIAAHVGLIMTDDMLEGTTPDTVKSDFIRRVGSYPLGGSGLLAFMNLQRCYFPMAATNARLWTSMPKRFLRLPGIQLCLVWRNNPRLPNSPEIFCWRSSALMKLWLFTIWLQT